MKQVILQKKNVWGNDLIYPVNDYAIEFAYLVGKKTFSSTDLKAIERLGFEIVYQ